MPLEEKPEHNSINLLVYLYQWRKPIIITTLLASIFSAIFSGPFFIKPKYESKVVFFPGSTSSISKAVLNESAGIKNDVLQFGEEEEAEHLLQILNSDYIRNTIISKYDLMSHYEIETDGSYPITKLNKKYDDNISFRRTEFMSIEISVLDTDPNIAALIANDIGDLVDSTKNNMQKEIAVKAFHIVKGKYEELIQHINNIKDSLEALGYLGVHDYSSQSEVLNREYALALANNDTWASEALYKRLEVLAKYGSTQMALSLQLENIYEEIYPIIKRKYEEAKVDALETLPQKFVVNRAYPAEKKSYPIRWLIVLVSTLSSFLATIFFILLLDKLSQVQKNIVENSV